MKPIRFNYQQYNTAFRFPSLREDLEIKKGDEDFFIIKDSLNGNVYRLRKAEYNVLIELDGNKTFFDILKIMRTKYKYDITKKSLSNFLEKALKLNILKSEHLNTKITEKKQNFILSTILYYNICSFQLEQLFGFIVRHLKFIFSFPCMLFCLTLMVIALVQTILSFPNVIQFKSTSASVIILAIFFLYVNSFIHEIAHGLCCRYYNIKVDAVGIKLIFFIPVFFCRFQEAWLKPKKVRLFIRISGIYSELFIYSILYLTNISLFHSDIISLLLFILLIKIIVNLIPFIPSDGYHILSEILDIPNLNYLTKNYLLSFFKNDCNDLNSKKKAVLFLYGITNLSFWVVLLVCFINFIGV